MKLLIIFYIVHLKYARSIIFSNSKTNKKSFFNQFLTYYYNVVISQFSNAVNIFSSHVFVITLLDKMLK